jgi:hypothetical protein
MVEGTANRPFQMKVYRTGNLARTELANDGDRSGRAWHERQGHHHRQLTMAGDSHTTRRDELGLDRKVDAPIDRGRRPGGFKVR